MALDITASDNGTITGNELQREKWNGASYDIEQAFTSFTNGNNLALESSCGIYL